MRINETFLSIQGEGTQTGLLTFFIRSTGCNLRCGYCDTKYAYLEGEEVPVDELVKRAKSSGAKIVCLTGGEPLLQPEINELAQELLKAGFLIDLETNGSLVLPEWSTDKRVTVAMDVKCPSSGMSKKMLLQNLAKLQEKDFAKFVIGTDEDYQFARKLLAKIPKARVYFHPVFGSYKLEKLASGIISDRLDKVVLGIQLHKIVWAPERRGV